MNKQPLISVVVPAYNIEHYLSKTLETILNQSYGNLEILIVDDGSQDATAEIANQMAQKDSRIVVICQNNTGVTGARLRGVSQARGEWIGFVDGDDFVDPDMYERLIHNALQYDAEISHCGYQMVLPSGNIDFYYNSGKTVIQSREQGCRDLLEGKFIEPGLVNKLYKRTLFDPVVIKIDRTIKINEDLLMNYYLFRQASCCVFEDFCPYHYVVRKGSAANSEVNENWLMDPVKVKKIIFEDTKNVPQLHGIVADQLVRQLVVLSAMDVRDHKSVKLPIRTQARKNLHQMLPDILRGSLYSTKSKMTAVVSAVFPDSYRLSHAIYARIKGIDHLYEK